MICQDRLGTKVVNIEEQCGTKRRFRAPSDDDQGDACGKNASFLKFPYVDKSRACLGKMFVLYTKVHINGSKKAFFAPR